MVQEDPGDADDDQEGRGRHTKPAVHVVDPFREPSRFSLEGLLSADLTVHQNTQENLVNRVRYLPGSSAIWDGPFLIGELQGTEGGKEPPDIDELGRLPLQVEMGIGRSLRSGHTSTDRTA